MEHLIQLGFKHLKPQFRINKPIRLIELFAGIGAQAKALENLGVEFEHYRICEFDRFAVTSYNAIHGTEFVQSDITGLKASDLGIVDTNQYCYILTYSFPCQDLSIAGKQAGMKKGSKTRSGLLWEVERLLNECTELPQVLLMENVTQVHSKKNSADFNKWIESLEDLGYSNYYADLNAKNYGVPQNRNRTFMISILGNYFYEFPEPFKLEKRLKDILESDVDEKYYLSSTILKGFEKHNERYKEKGTGFLWKPKTSDEIACCIRANSALSATDNTIIDEVIGSTQKNAYRGSLDGPCPALTTAMGEGGGNIPMIKQVAQLYPNSGNPQAGRIYDTDGLCCSIDTAQGGNRMPKIIENQFKIRKLTPKECFRLMTFDDTDFEKCKAAGISDSQLYKQAGNSIVVNVLVKIFTQLFEKK